MLLYIFLSCKPKLLSVYPKITSMLTNMKENNYIIVVGGDVDHYDNTKHILCISCNDYYEGLPEKVIKTYDFISNHETFNKYTHYCKLDDDMIVKKHINVSLLSNYCGRVLTGDGNRT